jgi:hypothetical protein
MLPPIRYPLPLLVLAAATTLVVWQGERVSRPLRSALADRLARAVAGPPVPSSTEPQVVAGPIVRRALLLHSDVPVAPRPGSAPSDVIRLRMFVDVYDVWPLEGEPAFYRVGNRKPLGWVKSTDLLPWDTRLVVRPPAGTIALPRLSPELKGVALAGGVSYPVVGWSAEGVKFPLWTWPSAWQAFTRNYWIENAALGRDDWGIWLSREELLALLLRPGDELSSSERQRIRLRALLGRLADHRPVSDQDLAAARRALPPQAFEPAPPSSPPSSEALARLNANWTPEATWSNLSFQFVPISALP